MKRAHLQQAVGAALGTAVLEMTPVSGGDIARSFRCTLADGRDVFTKTRAKAGGMFEAEARGLRWLAQAQALEIPPVLAVRTTDPPFLVLPFVSGRHRSADYDEALGRGLAALHRAGARSFGLDHDNFVGALPQSNATREDWPSFYQQCRLEPLVARAHASGLIDGPLRSLFDRLYAVLEQRCGPSEPPARLHGDLWTGNAIVGDRGQPVLIDPAAYGGHREIDLAMMRLFGGFSRRCHDAYHEAYPLASGHDRRVPLFQLYPLLVHVNLFGHGYVGQLVQALRDVLR